MIDAALFERFALNSSSPRDAIARINCEGGGDLPHLSDYAAEPSRILDGLSRALCKEWDHRMSRISDERHAPNRETGNWRPVVERPGPPLDRRAYEGARFLRPPRERAFKS